MNLTTLPCAGEIYEAAAVTPWDGVANGETVECLGTAVNAESGQYSPVWRTDAGRLGTCTLMAFRRKFLLVGTVSVGPSGPAPQPPPPPVEPDTAGKVIEVKEGSGY